MSEGIEKPVQVALIALKKTLAFYVLIGELVAFMGIFALGVSQLIPWWPHAAILVIASLFVTLLTILIAFGYVIIKDQGSIVYLKTEVQNLQNELKKPLSRRLMIESSLKGMFSDFLNHCNDSNEFLEFLKVSVFPFLVREFGFFRIGLTQVNDLSSDPIFLFCSSSGVEQRKNLERYDTFGTASIIDNCESTLEPTSIQFADEFVVHFLPVQDGTEASRWYFFSFYVEVTPPRQAHEQEIVFLDTKLLVEITNAFKRLHDRKKLRDLEQDIRHRHLCGVLRWTAKGINIDNPSDFEETDLARVSEIISEGETRECLLEAFYRDCSQAQNPIIIPRGSYNLSLVPVLMNETVYRVVFFLDEADGRILASDQTRWHSVFRLANYLHQGVAVDDITDLENKWYFERHLEEVVLDSNTERVLCLFMVRLSKGRAWEILDKCNHLPLKKVAQVILEWVGQENDPSFPALAARYEGATYTLVREYKSRANAEAQAVGIKCQIDSLFEGEDDGPSISIGVLSFQCGSIAKSNNLRRDIRDLLENGYQVLQSAEQTEKGIQIEDGRKPFPEDWPIGPVKG